MNVSNEAQGGPAASQPFDGFWLIRAQAPLMKGQAPHSIASFQAGPSLQQLIRHEGIAPTMQRS